MSVNYVKPVLIFCLIEFSKFIWESDHWWGRIFFVGNEKMAWGKCMHFSNKYTCLILIIEIYLAIMVGTALPTVLARYLL